MSETMNEHFPNASKEEIAALGAALDEAEIENEVRFTARFLQSVLKPFEITSETGETSFDVDRLHGVLRDMAPRFDEAAIRDIDAFDAGAQAMLSLIMTTLALDAMAVAIRKAMQEGTVGVDLAGGEDRSSLN